MVHEGVFDELLADGETLHGGRPINTYYTTYSNTSSTHLEFWRHVVRRGKRPHAGGRPVREVPVQETLVSAVVARRGQVRVQHVLIRRIARLEHENYRSAEEKSVGKVVSGGDQRAWRDRLTSGVGHVAEVSDSGKVGGRREEVVDVLSSR